MTAPMPHHTPDQPAPIHLIPLVEIDDAAIPRDRTALEPDALRELRDSIATHGLRMPVELFELAHPRDGKRYGIVSGLRRVTAHRELVDTLGLKKHDHIQAFLRPLPDLAAGLMAMVEENAIRADLSPWEQGRIATVAVEWHAYPTVEAAIDGLHPTATAVKRTRLRTVARVVTVLEGLLTEPERLSLRQLLRIGTALRNGFEEVIVLALQAMKLKNPDTQWSAILPYLVESERFVTTDPDPADAFMPVKTQSRGRPRRVARPRPGLTIRREMTRDGFILHMTGKDVTSGLVDEVIDEIERWLSPT
jgi:ParB family transcriptional regulator, chromosome partitioning protein